MEVKDVDAVAAAVGGDAVAGGGGGGGPPACREGSGLRRPSPSSLPTDLEIN